MTNELWAMVAAVAASLSALMAGIYTWLTLRLVKGQGEPKVVVFACGDDTRPSVIMIRIANIGRDVATDLQFTSSRPIPARAYGISAEKAPKAEEMTDGPLISGIPVLGPGDTRDITWGQFGGLLNAVGVEPIDLKFTYRHGRKKMSGQSRLEVVSFTATDASEKPDLRSAKGIEDIAKATTVIAEDVKRKELRRRDREIKRQQAKEPAGRG